MPRITQLVQAAKNGDQVAANELLPIVYNELKRMASHKMSFEKLGHTLNTTALVHEAYLRLVGEQGDANWDSRGHFFAAAAEAMRRILVENARRKARVKHGGEFDRVELSGRDISLASKPEVVLAVNDALERLGQEDHTGAELVKLRYFAGLSVEEAGNALELSRANAYRHWKFAKAWLQCELSDDLDPNS